MTTQPTVRAWRAARRRPLVAVAAALSLAAVTGSAAPSGAAPKKPAIEVYFLLDATADMGASAPAIAAAVDGISARLASRATLRHGYGIFRDVAIGSVWVTDLYQRLTPVRPNGGRLPASVRYSGGGDPAEAHTLALDAALGVEHKPWTIAPEPAGFGPAARKVVVLVTSARAKQDSTTYPPMDKTISRLRAAGVGVASLMVLTEDHDPQLVRRDLEAFSGGTGATARHAFDCDGDRRVDVRRGGPLVCELFNGGSARQSFAGFADAIAARYAR